jgi:hypothetical protein
MAYQCRDKETGELVTAGSPSDEEEYVGESQQESAMTDIHG